MRRPLDHAPSERPQIILPFEPALRLADPDVMVERGRRHRRGDAIGDVGKHFHIRGRRELHHAAGGWAAGRADVRPLVHVVRMLGRVESERIEIVGG